MTKILIEIQGNLYDFWEFRTLERDERYNATTGDMEYLLVVNRQSIATNYSGVEFCYPTEELRDFEYRSIKTNLNFFEGVVLVEAGISIKELKEKINNLKETDYEE